MNTLKSVIMFLTRPALEFTNNDNWKLSAFAGFFFAFISLLALIEYSNVWGRLITFAFAYLSGICLGATAIILERTDDEV